MPPKNLQYLNAEAKAFFSGCNETVAERDAEKIGHPPQSESDISRVIEMAWEDRTPFEAIEKLYGLNEHEVIEFMRSNMTRSSFKMWRKRMNGRVTKHLAMRPEGIERGYCATQYKHR